MNNIQLSKAEQAYQEEHFELSLSLYDDALRQGGDPALIHQGRAACHFCLHHYEDALREGKKAIELNPDSARSYLIIGQALTQLGEIDKAKDALLAAIDLDKQYFKAYIALAAIYIIQKSYPEATQAYLNAIEIDSQSWVPYFYLAQTYLVQKKYSDARQAYKIAFRLNPSFQVGFPLVISYYAKYVLWIASILIIISLIGIFYKKPLPLLFFSFVPMINGTFYLFFRKRSVSVFQFIVGTLLLILYLYLARLWNS